MQAVGQLASGIAHDFNNVLTPIIGFADLLLAKRRPTYLAFADIMSIKKQNAELGGQSGADVAFTQADPAAQGTLAHRRHVGPR